jgi:hypothetical protein
MNAYLKWVSVVAVGTVVGATPALAGKKDKVVTRYESRTYTYPPFYGYTQPEVYIERDFDDSWWDDDVVERHEWRRVPMATRQGTEVEGRIDSIRVFRLGPFDRQQAVAFVDTGDPELRRVVLGPADDLRPLGIRVGDSIRASGSLETIDGVNAVVATRFRTRSVQWENPPLMTTAVPESQWFHGVVVDEETEKLSHGVRHSIPLVRLDDGTVVRVDLGPSSLVRDSKIDEGDRIMLRGRFGWVDGQHGLYADEYRIDHFDD